MLHNCGIDSENNFLLESLAACHDSNSKLIMCFTVNTAFVNYIDQIDNLTDSLDVPILMDKITFEQVLPISLNASKFDSDLLTAPKTLKDFVHQCCNKKEIFDLKERHTITDQKLPKVNFFFKHFTIDVFLFVTVIISLLVTTLVRYILYKHMKLKMLVSSLALQQMKEVDEVSRQEGILPNIECTCKIELYTILMLSLSHLGLMFFFHSMYMKTKLCRGHLLSNAVKIMLFTSDEQYYVPIKLCRTPESIHLFKIRGTLVPENVKLKYYLIWDIIETDRKEVNMTLHGNKINLPKSVTIKFHDKFKIRHIIKREPLLFHIMLKQGITWFTLTSNNPPETV